MDTEFLNKDLEGYLEARRFAKVLSKEIISNIEAGMSEKDIEDVASKVFRDHDVKQHWHAPVIGVGEGSAKMSSLYALTSGFLTKHKRILREDDFVLIDISRRIAEHANNTMRVADVF
ncbi:MAG: aminopeptidase P family protein, partial [Euryarchaeota archaeon]|nr:aminopeptidase P family protein [Euryarchaeota archaeon]